MNMSSSVIAAVNIAVSIDAFVIKSLPMVSTRGIGLVVEVLVVRAGGWIVGCYTISGVVTSSTICGCDPIVVVWVIVGIVVDVAAAHLVVVITSDEADNSKES